MPTAHHEANDRTTHHKTTYLDKFLMSTCKQTCPPTPRGRINTRSEGQTYKSTYRRSLGVLLPKHVPDRQTDRTKNRVKTQERPRDGDHGQRQIHTEPFSAQKPINRRRSHLSTKDTHNRRTQDLTARDSKALTFPSFPNQDTASPSSHHQRLFRQKKR